MKQAFILLFNMPPQQEHIIAAAGRVSDRCPLHSGDASPTESAWTENAYRHHSRPHYTYTCTCTASERLLAGSEILQDHMVLDHKRHGTSSHSQPGVSVASKSDDALLDIHEADDETAASLFPQRASPPLTS